MGARGFLVLGVVFLVVTGSEALYADATVSKTRLTNQSLIF
jgi:K+ transporter